MLVMILFTGKLFIDNWVVLADAPQTDSYFSYFERAMLLSSCIPSIGAPFKIPTNVFAMTIRVRLQPFMSDFGLYFKKDSITTSDTPRR